MRISRQFRRDQRRGALPAVVAVLALLVQLLIPAASLAHEARTGGAMIMMCTAEGPVSVAAPDPGDHDAGFGGLKCHDCVMASVAAVGIDLPLTVPVRYAALAERIPQDEGREPVQSRAPPRPPSTAPPAFQNS